VSQRPEIDVQVIDGVIFDLDGVITKTASVHEASWAKLFNDYLRERAERAGEPFRAFESTDYLEFVDGKPRYDGVASFLESRGIELPWGTPDDPPEAETVCGLGNRKNLVFLQHLETNGVEPYDTTVDFVNELQRNGIETALISSSRNVTAVLKGAGLLDLFPVRIDGNVAAELGIPGKPDPAVFLEAASRIGAVPERAAIVEDAQSGVAAGRDGGFRMVIGVDRGDQAEELAAGGATVVVSDLGDFSVKPAPRVPRSDLPSAADRYDEIASRLEGSDVAVFLDYDGVLTPIVSHPDLAVLSEEMREVLNRLAAATTVAVLSGRDVADVRGKIQVPGIYYAGSHGFDVISPSGEAVVDERLDRFGVYLDPLDKATEMLEQQLGSVPGAQVERKRFAIAVHYRRVADEDYPKIEAAVEATAPEVPLLRVAGGKKIFEFRPDFDWDKGRALDWLLDQIGLDRYAVTPLYLGDDVTDEDAFRVVQKRGVGIVVGRDGEASHAHYALEDTDEVGSFLSRLAGALR
jgi:trehalose 6-phosphate phosphatase